MTNFPSLQTSTFRDTASGLPYDVLVERHTDWLLDRTKELCFGDDLPLIVPMTVTFHPGKLHPKKALPEFGRLHARLKRLLVTNPDRPTKRHLAPFCLAYKDNPSTRRKNTRGKVYDLHPGLLPHVHAALLVHPATSNRFREIQPELETIWRQLSPTNATLKVDMTAADRVEALMREPRAVDDEIRHIVGGWINYAAKLSRRRTSDGADTFQVFG